MSSKKFISKDRFLEMVLNKFMQDSIKGEKSSALIQSAYEGFKKLLSNQLLVSQEKEQEIAELYEILDKTYKIFSDERTRTLLLKSGKKANEIVKQYGEKIIGDNKRTYGMEILFNKGLIETGNIENGDKNSIKYVPILSQGNTQLREFVFRNYDEKTVSITLIGTLHYKTSFGVEKYINKYRISKQTSKSVYLTDDVFSNISIPDMENPDYKEAVLMELLGENNISLSHTGGYIGSVHKAQSSLKTGEQSLKKGIYEYRINDKYCLEYDAEDVTAVMTYQNQLEKEKKNSDKKISNEKER